MNLCGRHHGRDDLDCDDSETGCDLEVKIDNFTFAPQRVTVKAGTTVTWINEDDIPHTVASSTKTFKSKRSTQTTNSRSARLPSCSESR